MNGFLSLKFWLKKREKKSHEVVSELITLNNKIASLYCMILFGSALLVIAWRLAKDVVES